MSNFRSPKIKRYVGLGVAVLLSSVAFAQTATRTLMFVAASQLPDFAISVSAPANTIQGGQNLGASILITPENGFGEKLSLTCSGLPSGASCVFGGPLTQADGSFIIPMTISTQPLSSAVASSTRRFSVPVYAAFPLVVFLLAKRRNAGAKFFYQGLGLAIFAVAALGWVGCSGAPTPPSVTSTITITAQTQSGLSHGTQITITVIG